MPDIHIMKMGYDQMKRAGTIAAAVLALVMFSSCGIDDIDDLADIMDRLNRKPPENWYGSLLDYYVYGASDGWKNEELYGDLSKEIRDGSNRMGYCLADLNGDGGDEFLVGFIDDGDETRFASMWYYHPDLKRELSWSAECEGYYIYICEGNVFRMDTSVPRDRSEYMIMSKDPADGFPVQEYDDPPKPLKFELTPFDEVELPYKLVPSDRPGKQS